MTKKTIIAFLVFMLAVTPMFLYSDWFSGDSASALTLKRGSSGATVREVQTKLKNWGYYNGAVDGVYGAKTVEAVKYFQRKNKLTADGIAGPKTLAAMGIFSANSQNSAGNSASDVYLLARCVYGEARGEPYIGQVAVAAVVLNRVKSSSFPNTIAGVIYQPWAFTAVNDGQINLTPNDSAMNAARDALNGWDPTGGCLFYYNPVTATNQWIRQRTIKLTIGRHVFCV